LSSNVGIRLVARVAGMRVGATAGGAGTDAKSGEFEVPAFDSAAAC
jgi:hypothetical protein